MLTEPAGIVVARGLRVSEGLQHGSTRQEEGFDVVWVGLFVILGVVALAMLTFKVGNFTMMGSKYSINETNSVVPLLIAKRAQETRNANSFF